MAPLPVIADVFRVAFEWEGVLGQTATNVLHFSAPGKTSAEVFNALQANGDNIIFATVSDAASIVAVRITPLDGSGATFVGTPTGTWHTGGRGGDQMPQVAVLVKLATALRGPANRGRIFLPFTAEGAQAHGEVVDTNLTAMRAGWVTFLNDMAGDGVALGVASYVHENWHQAINVTVETETGTQRRRQQRNR